jgi:tetratricopeptide (TPR) repeat protein
MQIALESPFRKRLLLAAVLLLAGAYVAFAGASWIADFLAYRPGLTTFQWAVRLDPGNADFYNRLGHYYDFLGRDPASAFEAYKKAVQFNPHKAKYWLDLANTYQVMGDEQGQKDAIEQAVRMDPTTPVVAWQAANLYLVQGETEKALRAFHVVLEGDGSYSPIVMQLCWRVNPDVDTLLRTVVPAYPYAYLAFLSQLMSKGETEGAAKVWDGLIRLRQPIDLQAVFSYVQYLLTHKEVAEASLAWRQATGLLSLNAYLPSSHNLIVNPNFSLDVLNGGFDWRYNRKSGVSLTLDSKEFHSGQRSLSIVFDGPGVEDAGIYQLIPVQPDTTYEFSGYYKNGEIEGAGGPHLVLQDAFTSTTYFQSEELRDGLSWKGVAGVFTTGPETAMLILRVQRVPPGRPIRGTLWIDDFRLVEQNDAGGPT